MTSRKKKVEGAVKRLVDVSHPEIVDAVSKRPWLYAWELSRTLSPIPEGGEPRRRARFLTQWHTEHTATKGESKRRKQWRDKAVEAWNASEERYEPSYLRRNAMWRALHLFCGNYREQVQRVEDMLEIDHPKDSPTDWRLWPEEVRTEMGRMHDKGADPAEIAAYPDQVSGKTIHQLAGCLLHVEKRMKTVLNGTGVSWRDFLRLDFEDRCTTLVLAYCRSDEGMQWFGDLSGVSLDEENESGVGHYDEPKSVTSSTSPVPRASRTSNAAEDVEVLGDVTRQTSSDKEQIVERMDRDSLEIVCEKLGSGLDVDALGWTEVKRLLRNIEVPESMTWTEFRQLCENADLPVSQTNATWSCGGPVYRDGTWFVRDGQQDKEVRYTKAEGVYLLDESADAQVDELAAGNAIYDYFAYNGSRLFSAAEKKNYPRRRFTAAAVANVNGNLEGYEFNVASLDVPQTADGSALGIAETTAEGVEKVAELPKFFPWKVKLNLESVNTNPTDSEIIRNLTFDIDTPDAIDTLVHSGLVPPPTYMVENSDDGKAHVTYVLDAPVFGTSDRRLKIARAMLSELLEADRHYTMGYTKNPFSPSFITHWGPPELIYNLDTLTGLAEAALVDNVDADNVVGMTGRRDMTGVNRFLKRHRELLSGNDEGKPKTATPDGNDRSEIDCSRHQRTFWLTREFAAMHWRDGFTGSWSEFRSNAQRYERWQREVQAKAYAIGERSRQMMPSNKGRFLDREIAEIVTSILSYFATRYTGRAADDTIDSEQRRRGTGHMQTAQFRDFENTARIVLAEQSRNAVFDQAERKVYLPEAMSIDDFKSLAATRYAAPLDRRRCRRYLVERRLDKRRVDHRLRTMSDLNVMERRTILSRRMNLTRPESYSELEKRYQLVGGTFGRLVAAYKKNPARIIGDSRITADEAQQRWAHCVAGTGETLFTDRAVCPLTFEEGWIVHESEQQRIAAEHAAVAEMICPSPATDAEAEVDWDVVGTVAARAENQRHLDENWTSVFDSPSRGVLASV